MVKFNSGIVGTVVLVLFLAVLQFVAIGAGDVAAPEEACCTPSSQDILGFSERAPEAHPVLAQGAEVLNLKKFKTYAVVWFPVNYKKFSPRRTLFTLHGSHGNAYMGIEHQLKMARKYHYGLVSLQWWRGAEHYMQPQQIYEAFGELTPFLVSHYGMDASRVGLETFSRSASLSYELAYWDHVKGVQLFKLIIAQSGGIPREDFGPGGHPRPLIAKMLQGELGPKPLAGERFFLYCGQKDHEWGLRMCDSVRHAKEVIEAEGGTVIRFIDDPNGDHGGMHNIPRHFQSSVDAFLAATR